MTLRNLLLGSALLGSAMATAQAATTIYPGTTGVYYQTSGRERPPTVGDWYTTNPTLGGGSSSTDRVHRVLVEITASQILACGGTCDIIVLDAESTPSPGDGDEQYGANPDFTQNFDPVQFALRSGNGATLLSGPVVVPAQSPNGTSITFTVSAAGTYQVTSETGGFPVSGDTTSDRNDDDNSWGLSIEGSGDGSDGFVGLLRTSFQQDTGANLTYNLFFLLGPTFGSDTELQLRNFDLDNNASSIVYTAPNGTTYTGTKSLNGVWNNSGTLNTGFDSVIADNGPPTSATQAGVWTYTINDWTSNNQTVYEVNGDGVGFPLGDRAPTRAGNAAISITGPAACAPVGTALDYSFTVTNNFVTNDIINLTLTPAATGWTAVLLDSAGNPLTNHDNINGLNFGGFTFAADTDLLAPGQSRSFILRVTPSATAFGPYNAAINGLSYMDRQVVPGNDTIYQAVQGAYVCPTIAKAFAPGTVASGANATMTLTLSNQNTVPLTNAAFTDALPTNLVNSTPLALGGTCTGITTTATAGGTSFNVTAATVPSGTSPTPGSCTITEQVVSNTTGSYNNTTSGVSGQFGGVPIGPGAPSNTATLIVGAPVLSAAKSSAVFSDPANGTTNPKRIPGSFVDYTIAVTNSGTVAVDSNTTQLVDAIPANTALFVGDLSGAGTGPVAFVQGTPSSTLTYTFTALNSSTDDVSFSNDGAVTFGYTPTADANGVDTTVTHIRIEPKGAFVGNTGSGNPSFTGRFRVRVQ